MSDLISREDAKRELQEKVFRNLTGEFYGTMQVLDELPSAEQEEFEWCTDCKEYDKDAHCCHRWTKCIRQTIDEIKSSQWIPCSERLPKVDEYVLVYINDIAYIAWIDMDGDWCTDEFVVEMADSPNAWMPLPQPFKGDE